MARDLPKRNKELEECSKTKRGAMRPRLWCAVVRELARLGRLYQSLAVSA